MSDSSVLTEPIHTLCAHSNQSFAAIQQIMTWIVLQSHTRCSPDLRSSEDALESIRLRMRLECIGNLFPGCFRRFFERLPWKLSSGKARWNLLVRKAVPNGQNVSKHGRVVCLFFVFIIDVLQKRLVVKFAYAPHNFAGHCGTGPAVSTAF